MPFNPTDPFDGADPSPLEDPCTSRVVGAEITAKGLHLFFHDDVSGDYSFTIQATTKVLLDHQPAAGGLADTLAWIVATLGRGDAIDGTLTWDMDDITQLTITDASLRTVKPAA
jgi:hypothetical protein